MNPIANRFVSRWLLLLTLVLTGPQLPGQSRRIPIKKSKPMITLTHPTSGIKVTFHDPVFTDNPLRESAWRQLTVHTKDTTYTLKLKSTEGYLINPDFANFWSPDGQYISLYYLYNVVSKDDYSRQVLTFIGLEYGEAVDFTTKDGRSLTSIGTFDTWVKGKPHTVVTSTGQEAEPL